MTKTFCDGCAVELGANPIKANGINYVIISDRRVELCDVCATPILAILKKLPPPFGGSRPRSHSGGA